MKVLNSSHNLIKTVFNPLKTWRKCYSYSLLCLTYYAFEKQTPQGKIRLNLVITDSFPKITSFVHSIKAELNYPKQLKLNLPIIQKNNRYIYKCIASNTIQINALSQALNQINLI